MTHKAHSYPILVLLCCHCPISTNNSNDWHYARSSEHLLYNWAIDGLCVLAPCFLFSLQQATICKLKSQPVLNLYLSLFILNNHFFKIPKHIFSNLEPTLHTLQPSLHIMFAINKINPETQRSLLQPTASQSCWHMTLLSTLCSCFR